MAIPDDLDYDVIPGLSRELRERLSKFLPTSLGQASRISGITPAALTALMVGIRAAQAARCVSVDSPGDLSDLYET